MKSSVRTCQILRLVGEKRGLKHSELARALRIPSSSLSGLLVSLVRTGFLELDESSQKYSIGPEVLALAGSYLEGLDLVEISRPVVCRLAEETAESVAVAVRVGAEIMVVCKHDSPQAIRRTIQIGERAPLHATASGKVILAYVPPEDAERFLASAPLAPLTPRTMTDAALLLGELEQVRRTGFAYNREESTAHIVALAAPLFDFRRAVEAALVVSLPASRFDGERDGRLRSSLGVAALGLSRKLGFRGELPSGEPR